MKRSKRFLAMLLGLFFSFSLAACSGQGIAATTRAATLDAQKTESENRRLHDELLKAQEKLVIKEAELNQLKDAQEVLRKDHNLEAFPERPEDYIYFPVYTSNEKGDVSVLFFTAIPSVTTLVEKLEILTRSISRSVFDDYIMEFTGILEIDGRKVAQVDLQDSGRFRWEKAFFPDKATGDNTQATLAASYLQGTYRMDWVDGVVVTHNGETIENPYLSKLAEPVYRNGPAPLE